MARNIELTSDGDWNITTTNELRLTTPETDLVQQVRLLLTSQPGDYVNRPGYGFNRAKYLSKPNTEKNVNELRQELYESISRIKDIQQYDVFVDAYPTDPDKVRVDIEIRSQNGTSNTISSSLAFGAGQADNNAYTIQDHYPYDLTSSRPIIEIKKITTPTSRVKVAHLPINTDISVYEYNTLTPIVDNQMSTQGLTVLSGTVMMPSGTLSLDLSGTPISGHLQSTTFIIDQNLNGDAECYGIRSSLPVLATFTDNSGDSFFDYMQYGTAVSGYINDFTNSVIYTVPDLAINKTTITTPDLTGYFDLVLYFDTTYCEALKVISSDVELDKNSIAFNGRSDKTWEVLLSRQLPSGTYAIAYNTFTYE